ncbi:MAG: hypothetical protein HY435_03235 [Candidatus Liptonbacteria bacterium]|nr:hypothetical protein [Candidatus Liptonbacteria bacterium]
MIQLITYDLNAPGKDYTSLYEAIKNLGAWWHYLDSTWLVDTQMTTSQVSNQLKPKMDQNDHFLVIRVTKDYQGWLPQEAWNWMNDRIF